jgi:hypothetical protein
MQCAVPVGTYVTKPLHQALDEALEREGAISALMFRFGWHLRAPSCVANAIIM